MGKQITQRDKRQRKHGKYAHENMLNLVSLRNEIKFQ